MARGRLMVAVAVAGLLLSGASALAQQDAPKGKGRGGFNPDEFRQRMMQSLKERLGVTDEEFKALQPKIEAVMTAQRNMRGGMRGMFGGGRGGAGGGGDTTPDTAVGKAQAELQKALENKESKAEELSAKLAALREAREKARAELAKAQKELKELLTQRQEATLVMWGILD